MTQHTDHQPLTDLLCDEIEARQRVADQILPIVFATNVSRTACLGESPDAVVQLTAQRIADNVTSWVACGDWTDRPLTEAEIDAAEADSVSVLAKEVRRLRAVLAATPAAAVVSSAAETDGNPS